MKRWVASVRLNYKLHHLGVFRNEEDAATAVKKFKVEQGLLKEDGTVPTVHEAFLYSDGVLFHAFNSPKHRIGDAAGFIRPDGYVQVKYSQKKYFVHRLIWEMHNGAIPDGMEIDHIDGDRSNNLVTNLRIVSRLENARNLKLNRGNKTGIPGVMRANGKYRVTIGAEYLGYFESLPEAVAARKKAEKQRNYHANHGRN